MEENDDSLLKQKPRNQKEGILTKEFSIRVLWQGALISVVTLISYFIGLKISPESAATYAFITLTAARLFHGFNCRNEGSVFKIGMFSNKYSIGAFLLGIMLVFMIVRISYLKDIFNVVTISSTGLIIIFILSFIPTAVIQLIKYIKEKKSKK